MKKIIIVVGTRPNFIKITQFPCVLKNYSQFDYKIVHTGQHYDAQLSDIFFRQFDIFPDIFLGIESGTPAAQIGNIMIALEKTFNDYKPDLILVVGDVNSTLAAALTANKMNIPLAHLESGLRSFDTTMPEEYNRILTDAISDFFFVTEQSGMDNLLREGKHIEKIFFVGNTMIDTLVAFESKIDASDILHQLSIRSKEFVLLTMHRPSNVDSAEGLSKLMELITFIGKKYRIVFPIHPRTVKNLKRFNLYEKFSSCEKLVLTQPLDYFSFQKLIKECCLVITDSGGIQEETTFRLKPCLTLRNNTERPVTCTIGTNTLVPLQVHTVLEYIRQVENHTYKKGKIPPLWDGHATERIFSVLEKIL